MQIRRWLLFLSLLATGLLDSRPLRAQCLSLAALDKSVAAGSITPDSLQVLLPPSEWVLHPGDSPYWTYYGPGQTIIDEEQVAASIGLRRSNGQGYYDLVYKTTRQDCITQLRTELRRRGKLKSEPVSCVECEAERLMGEGYTVTIFNQKAKYVAKHTPYPYVLVLRRVTGTAGSGPAAEASSQLTGEH